MHQLLIALERLNDRLGRLSLPDQAEDMTELVVRQQQLLEAYVRSAGTRQIDYELISRVMDVHKKLLGRARLAHGNAAKELDSLSQSRSAVSAYKTVEERQYTD